VAQLLHVLNNNGSNGSTLELEAAFADRPDYIFRHFEDCKFPMMTWQCGRSVINCVEYADGSGGEFLEYFELICWASTQSELIDKLSAV
jgi:hypothetical protein